MSDNLLRMFIPQWQGSGNTNDIYFSAMEIYDLYLKDNEFISIDVSHDEILGISEGILGLDAIVTNLERIKDVLNIKNPKKIFSIGGDCGIELGPVSYLNTVYNQDLAVIWFDAHGDLNTSLSSPSGHFHGMPLRCLLGEGEKHILRHCFSYICPDQVILTGVRELDPAEEEYINNNNVSTVSTDLITNSKDIIADLIRSKGFRDVYVHVDLDVLDANCFPYSKCPVVGGISKQQLLEQLYMINDGFNIVGFSIVEYLSTDPNGKYELQSLVDFGLRIK